MNINNNEIFQYQNGFKKYSHIKSNLIWGDINHNINPLITIAIPTYKRANMLKEAIDSALEQNNFDDYEIIVVDNDADSIGYESETEILIKNYNNPKILYYKNMKNLGIYGNWNRCLELARGKWYTMLHDDDLLLKSFMDKSFSILGKHPDISALKVRHEILDQRSGSQKKVVKEFLKNFRREVWKYSELDFLISNPIGGPVGVIMDREKALAIGGFLEEYYPASDYIFFIKYCITYNLYYYNKVLCLYRVSKNESLNNGTMINSTKIHYDMINLLRGRNAFRNFFFKEYSLYFSLNALKEIKSFWKVDVKKEEIDFLGKNPILNPFISLVYTIFKKIWVFKRFIF